MAAAKPAETQAPDTVPAPDDESSAAAGTVTARMGEVLVVKQGCVVERPDGTTHIVIGGSYVLDVDGDHWVDGSKVTVA